MKNQQDVQSRFDLYLRNQMADPEREAFESALQKDADLLKEFEFYRDIFLSSRRYFRSELKDQLKKLEEKEVEKSASTSPSIFSSFPNRSKTYFALGIAAVISLFILIGISKWYPRAEQAMGENLFLSHFEPYPNVVEPLVRSDAAEINDPALLYYEQGDYSKALDIWSETSVEQRAEYKNFYAAISFMALGQPDEAIELLKTINNDENRFYMPARWYEALAYLQKDDKEKAQKALHYILTRDRDYVGRARSLLDTLN